jgi:hypothetical protein
LNGSLKSEIFSITGRVPRPDCFGCGNRQLAECVRGRRVVFARGAWCGGYFCAGRTFWTVLSIGRNVLFGRRNIEHLLSILARIGSVGADREVSSAQQATAGGNTVKCWLLSGLHRLAAVLLLSSIQPCFGQADTRPYPGIMAIRDSPNAGGHTQVELVLKGSGCDASGPSPSMRRPVSVKSVFLFPLYERFYI